MDLTTANSKKDVVTLRIDKGSQWIVRHWQQVLLAVAALAVAAGMTLFVANNLKKLRYIAWEQLSLAQAQAARGQRKEALQTIDQLLAANRSGELVTQAHLFRGDVLLLEGNNAEAVKAYQEAARQATTPELKALAAAGLTVVYEQDQKWPQAEETCRQFIKDFPEHFLAARLYETLGRAQMLQQKWSEAQNTFERLITLYPTSPWAKNAQDYLNTVKTQLSKAPAP